MHAPPGLYSFQPPAVIAAAIAPAAVVAPLRGRGAHAGRVVKMALFRVVGAFIVGSINILLFQ